MKKLTLLIALLSPLNLIAETLFVSDTLRVGIRPEPSKSVASISIIKTGAEVEILTKKNSYAKIRTTSGVEGWVKSAYLTRKTPANNKLAAANKKIKILEKDLTRLQTSHSEKSTVSQLKLEATIKKLQTDKKAILAKLSELKTIPASTTSNAQKILSIAGFDIANLYQDRMYIVFGGVFGMLVIGFMSGASWYKQQVTKRLGGLSI